MAPVQAPATPIPDAERVQAIDVLRGFAIFGILVVNMEGYDWPILAMRAIESGHWPGLADKLTAYLIGIAATDNFITLLAVLFGLGFALQMRRAERVGMPFVPLQIRRSAILLLIGVLHGLLIWSGDILIFFSLLATLLLLFRNLAPRALLGWAIGLYAVSFVWPEWQAIRHLTGPVAVTQTLAEDPAALVERSLAVYSHGSYLEITRQRAADLATWIPHLPERVSRKLAAFVFGLFLGRRGNVKDLLADPLIIRRVLGWGLGLGIGGTLLVQLIYLSNTTPVARVFAIPLNAICKPALTCGYAGLVLYLFHETPLRSWLVPVAAVGRMSLSNYLLQSVLCTLVFYSYGLGLYGQVGPAAGLALTMVIFAVNLLLSVPWARRFRFGPVEWLWRSLTYGRLQPLRRL